MIRKVLIHFRIFLFLALLLAFGCGKQETNKKISKMKDWNNPTFTIGCMTGTLASREACKKLPKAVFKEYSMPIDAFTAICSGKVDAVVLDRPTLEFMALAHPELTVMKQNLAMGHISVAAAKNNKVLMHKVNQFIRKYRKDGTYKQMYERWFSAKNSTMPKLPKSPKTVGVLKVGITANNEPLCFIKNGELAGFDTEFSLRLGLYLNKTVEFIDIPYDALTAALGSGKIDLAVAYMDAMPEREESVLFSADYIKSPITILYHKGLQKHNSNKITSWKELNDPKWTIACESEVLSAREAKKAIPNAKYQEFPSPMECYISLSSGKADAVVYDRPALEYASMDSPKFFVLPENLAVGHISVAAKKGNTELITKVNAFIRQYRKDGTYKQMYDRWVHSKNMTMPHIPKPKNPDGTLVIGITADNAPMCSIQHGQYCGFDIEFAERMALFMNKKIKYMNFVYDGLVPALASGKIDLAVAQMDATPERGDSVLFSEEYIDSPVAVMIRKKDYAGNPIQKFEDLAGKKIGTLTGSVYDLLAKKYLPHFKAVSFPQISQMIAALEGRKIDALFIDEPIGRYILLSRPHLSAMEQKIPCGDFAFLFSKKNSELCQSFSAEIKKMKADGTLEKIQQKWFSTDESKQVMPQSLQSNKTVLFSVIPEVQPFVFIRNGQIVGYEVETAILAANRLGYNLKINLADYTSVIAQLNSGKSDFAAGCIITTKERQEQALFSEPVYKGAISILLRKTNDSEEQINIISSIKNAFASLAESFDKTFIRESRWKLILQGLATTLVITFFSVILGTILAFPVCMMCRSKRRLIAWLGDRYVSLIMGTPILVILMILYYVVFAKVDINGIFVAILAFGLDFAAYTSVTLRSGIDGIPRGQTEAALALGHSPTAAFLRFIMPQAVRTVLPVYRGEVISTLKSTSIVGYIAIMDLTKMGDIIRSRTYEAFFPLIAIAVIYFLAAKGLTLILLIIEKKMDPENRRTLLLKRGAE